MTKKQEAINKACDMFQRVCEYRGIKGDENTDLYIPRNATIAHIEGITKQLEEYMNIPLKPATEKQMNYLMKLSKEYPEENKRISESKLNTFQASKLIQLYKYTDDLLYSHYPIASCEETYIEIDNEIDYILSKQTF